MSKTRKKSSPFLLLSNDSSKNLRLSEISVNNSTCIPSTKNLPCTNPLRGPTPDNSNEMHRLSLSPNPKNVCVKFLDRKMTSGKSIDNLLTYNIENSEITRIQGLLLAKEEEIAKLKAQLEASMNDNTYKLKEKEARDLAKKLAESNLAEERLRKELSKELEDWKAKYINLEKRAEKTKTDFEQSKHDIDSLKTAMSNLELELEKLKKNNVTLEDERGRLQKKIDLYLNEQNDVGRERNRNEELQKRVASLEAELKSAQAENTRVKDDLSKWKIATGKIESEWGKKLLETEQIFMSELQKKINAEQEKFVSLSLELEKFKSQNSQYQEKVALLSCEIERLKTNGVETEDKTVLLSCEIERLNSMKLEAEEKTALLCCELERLKELVKEKDSEKDDVMKRYRDVAKALQEMTEENYRIKLERETNENSQKQRIFTLSCEVEELRDRLNNKEKNEQYFQLELSEKKNIQGEKEYWKEQYINSEKKMNQELEKFKESKNRLEQSIKALDEERQDWKARYTKLESSAREISEELVREKILSEKQIEKAAEFKNQYSDLERKIEDTIDDYEARIGALVRDNLTLKTFVEETKLREGSLRSELNEQKSLLESTTERLRRVTAQLDAEKEAGRERIKQYEDLEIRYSAQGNVEKLLVEAKREKIIAESQLETQTRHLKEEIARIRSQMEGISKEGDKESTRLIAVLDSKNQSINELQEKLCFLSAKLQSTECPINKESRSLMAERVILLSIENERLISKIKVLKEESANMKKNFELESYRFLLESSEEINNLNHELMIYKKSDGRKSNVDFISFGVPDIKKSFPIESEPTAPPNVDTCPQTKLEKLISGEQVLALKHSLEEKSTEVEELKSKLKINEEQSNILKKRNEEFHEKLQESIGFKFALESLKSSSSNVLESELANTQRELARLNQENSSLKIKLEENLEELYERDDRLYALSQKLKLYESDSKRNVYSFEDFENLERKLRDLEVQIMKMEKDQRIIELQNQLQTNKATLQAPSCNCLSLTISLEEKNFQNKVIILENEYLQEEIAIMRNCFEGDSSTQRDIRESSLDFRFYKRKIKCLEEDNLALLEKNDSENSLARVLVGLARKNKELNDELGAFRYLQKKVNRLLRKDARGACITLVHESVERIELLQRLFENCKGELERGEQTNSGVSDLSQLQETRYWQDLFIRVNSNLLRLLSSSNEKNLESKDNITNRVANLLETLSQKLTKRANSFEATVEGRAIHSQNLLQEETLTFLTKTLHEEIQSNALSEIYPRRETAATDNVEEMVKDFELEYWRSIGGGVEPESIDLYRSIVPILTKDLDILEKENTFLKSMLPVETGAPLLTDLECLNSQRLELLGQCEINLKKEINKYKIELEHLKEAIKQEKEEKVKKSSENQQNRSALENLKNELENAKAQIRLRDQIVENLRSSTEEQTESLTSQEQRISSQENKISSQEQKLLSQEQKISSQEQKISSQEQKILSLEQKISSLEQKISTLETKNKQLSSLLAEAESKYEILETDSDQKENLMKRELDDLAKTLRKSENQNSALSLEVDDLNEKLRLVESDMKRSIEQKERKIIILAEENSRLRSESDNLNEKILNSLETTINDLRRELKLREETVKEEKSKRERDVNALQEALCNKEKEIEETEEYYEAKTRNYDMLLEEKEKFTTILEQDRKNLSDRVKALENDQNEKTSSLAEAKVDRLKRENEKLSNIVVDKNREITQLQQRINEVEAQISVKISEEIASREAYYQTQIENEIKSLMEEFKNKENLFESEKERTLKENSRLQQTFSELTQENNKLKDACRRIRAEVSEEFEQRSARQIDELRKEWELLAKRKIESEVKTLTLAFTAERVQSEDRINQLISEKQDVEQKYLREVQEIKRELAHTSRTQLEREIRDIKEKAMAEKNYLEKELAKNEQKLNDAEKYLNASQRERNTLAERLKELERENEVLRRKINELKGAQENESENVQKMLEKEEILTVNQRHDREKLKLEKELHEQLKAKSQLEEKTLDIASKLQETLREKKRLEKENKDLNTQVKSAESDKENIFSKIKDYWDSDMKEKVEFEIKLLISKFQKEKAYLESENRKLKALVNINGGLDVKSKTMDQMDFNKYKLQMGGALNKKQGRILE